MNSFGFMFKSKNWLRSFVLITIVTFFTSLLGTAFSFSPDRTMNIEGPFGNLEAVFTNPNSSEVAKFGEFLSPFLLPISLFLLIFSIISVFINSFYYYEVTQSVMQKRDFTFIFSAPLSDSIKKVLKLIAVGIVYSLFFFVFFCFLSLCFGLVIQALLGGGNFNNLVNLGNLSFVAIIFLCFTLLVTIFFLATFYLFMMSAYYRLLLTNTFAEALNLSKVFSFFFRNFFKMFMALLLVILITILITIVVLLPTTLLTVLAINVNSGIIFWITQIVSTFFASISGTYLLFMSSGVFGNVFREISERDQNGV